MRRGQRRYSKLEPASDLWERAVRKFGTTTDIREAGYILPDGRMLDFSEKHQGGPRGERYRDHREIIGVLDPHEREGLVRGPNEDPRAAAMVEFMGAGAIRVAEASGHGIFLDFVKQPSPRQRTVLRDVLREHEHAVVELTRPDTGTVVVWRGWGKPGEPRLHPDAILRWMGERGYAGLRRQGLSRIALPEVAKAMCSQKGGTVTDLNPGDSAFLFPDGCVVAVASHYRIWDYAPESEKQEYRRGGPASMVVDAIAQGAIRLVWEGGRPDVLGIEYHRQPTDKQASALRYLINRVDRVYLDQSDGKGLVVNEGSAMESWDHGVQGRIIRHMRAHGFKGARPRLGAMPRVARPAGTPSGRLKFHWDPYRFKIALRKAEKCGKLEKECHVKADRWGGRPMTTCTWRTSSGKIVAAAASGSTRAGGIHWTSASLWTDRALLAGRCPEED